MLRDEKEFERVIIAAIRSRGDYADKISCDIPGFPDLLIHDKQSQQTYFAELKYIRPSDMDGKFIHLFQPTQPAKLIRMLEHGIDIRIAAYDSTSDNMFQMKLSLESFVIFQEKTVRQMIDERIVTKADK